MRRTLMIVTVILMLFSSAAAGDIVTEQAEVTAFAARIVPDYTLLDGILFDRTAMLLLEDTQGQVFFAGCTKDDEKWAVNLSTPFPAWMCVSLDTYHAGEGSMRLWISRPSDTVEYEDYDELDAYIELQQDGIWRVYGVNNGADVLEFRRHGFYDDLGYAFYGDLTLPLDITLLDWAALPWSVSQAMALVDTSNWRLVAAKYSPVYAKADTASAILSLGMVGAPVQVLSCTGDMVQVRFIGSTATGWMQRQDLLPGEEQITRYNQWYYADSNVYGAKEIILDSDDPPVTWYGTAHDESAAAPFSVDHVEYVTVLGWCTNVCCYHVYSETTGTSGFVPISQMPYTIR